MMWWLKQGTEVHLRPYLLRVERFFFFLILIRNSSVYIQMNGKFKNSSEILEKAFPDFGRFVK